MNMASSVEPAWFQRVGSWLRQLNRQRLVRRKARKQRAIDRAWLRADDPQRPEVARALQQRAAVERSRLKFSVIVWPTGDEPVQWHQGLHALSQSLHPDWELLWPWVGELAASADARIRTFETKNVTGVGQLELAWRNATGSHVVFVPSDWIPAPHALLLVAEAIAAFAPAQMIYGDDDCVDAHGQRHSPCMRCDWNQELLRSGLYVNGLVAVRSDALPSLGTLEAGTWRAAWWSLLLRLAERLQAHEVLHVPHVLGHRMSNAGASHEPLLASDAELAVLQAHLDRSAPGAVAQRGAEGGVHVGYPVPEPMPWVSLIIPTRNGLQLLRQCVQSIVDKTDYAHYEIVIVDNGSDDDATLEYLQQLRGDARIRVHRDDRPFNFSALNNAAVRICRGTLVGLINNDIEVIHGGWLREMVGLALRPDVGAVGARLWFADGTLQHAGVVLGIGGIAAHVHRLLPRAQPGYHGRARLTQEFSAVTAACLVLRREVFDRLGGLDEVNLAVDYNDIDFCLRIRRAGLRVIWTPHAQLYHHESATRGRQRPAAQQQRYDREVAFMQTTWRPWLHNDPAYNPNLTLRGTQFELAERPRVDLVDPWYRMPRPPAAAAPLYSDPLDASHTR
jgi:GT2 family glycosyltransferase